MNVIFATSILALVSFYNLDLIGGAGKVNYSVEQVIMKLPGEC